MNDFYYDLGFSLVFGLVKQAFKSSNTKKRYSPALRKLQGLLNALFAEDDMADADVVPAKQV